ncbi:MAG: PhoH family protein [Firmicutes bacterium]|nr:PhoH family protein [Bacillota bacterium]
MQNETATKRFILGTNEEALNAFGRYDENLSIIEKAFGVTLLARGNEIVLSGDPSEVESVSAVLEQVIRMARKGPVAPQQVRYIIGASRTGSTETADLLNDTTILVTARGKQIKPRTIGQKQYVDAIRDNALTFGIGPAGTGKTYLAVSMAVAAFRNREFNRIVLTRPAVEAGERLGFLPGTLEEKVNPYLRPLYDALFDVLGVETFEKFMAKGLIEVAPLAYMRGRTLDDSFVILDEAQNTTPEQMKMLLTRLGIGSKAVVTGDITQIDLPKGTESGLLQVRAVLKDVEGVSFVYLTEQDVVRHELVQRIIRAYDRFESRTPPEGGR